MTASDPQRRFGGIERLHGAGCLARLAAAHVVVIGIGGVGSWATEALARSGIGRLTLIDLDHVAESNVNRQIHALETTLGQAKVRAMTERIAGINPDCVVHCIEEFVTPDNLAELLPACAGVVDAIDQVRAKAALIAHCRHAGIAVVTTGGAGGRSDPTWVKVADLARTVQDPLASKVRARLRKEYGYPRDPKKKFGVECVHSEEPIRRPNGAACDVATGNAVPGEPSAAPYGNSAAALHGLNCAGYGSSVCVTATFGFVAAARIIDRILRA